MPGDTAVEATLRRLTLEQKVGQLMIVAFPGAEFSPVAEEVVRHLYVGGIILFQQNIGSPRQTRELTDALQRAARSSAAGVPLFIAADQEGGVVVRATTDTTVFAGNMALGASFSRAAVRAAATTTATELMAMGINTNLAPVVDVNSNAANPVIGTRAFGGEARLVAQLGAAAIAGYQERGVLAVAKHFPGHGDAGIDSHQALPVISHALGRLEAVELPPFREAVNARVDGIMTGHVSVPALEPRAGLSATLSPRVLSYLRVTLGYQGLIITDDLEMGAIVNDYGTAEAAKVAFHAGADVLLFRRNVEEQKKAHRLLVDAVRSGAISQARLDASVRRILAAKQRRGLLDEQQGTPLGALEQVGSKEHLGVAEDVARQAVTLVRNANGLLPLTPHRAQQLCVVHPQVASVSRVEVPVLLPGGSAETLAGAVRALHPKTQGVPVALETSPEQAEAALDCAQRADVLVVGSYNLHEYPAQRDLIRKLLGLGRPTVVVALRLPYDLVQLPEAQAYIATYSNRPVALSAAAAVLFGRAQPTGHLPVPLGDLYPTGHGMPDFRIAELRADLRD